MQITSLEENPGPHPHAGEADRAHQVAALAADIGRAIAVARVLAAQRRDLRLDGLDSRVGLLCAQLLDLGPEAARTLRPLLHGLRAELDALAGELLQPGAP